MDIKLYCKTKGEKMKKATLFDSPINTRHDLSSLVEKHGNAISIGRGEKSVIQAGKNSGNPHFRKISRSHAILVYDAVKDEFVYTDYSSTNHSRIKRGNNWISIDETHPKESLQTGDQIYFAKSLDTGYGPLIFSQGEEETELNNNEGTQRVD